VDSIRSEIISATEDGVSSTHADRHGLKEMVIHRIHEFAERNSRAHLRKVINATGVVIHTNLGRAPLSDAAREALFKVGTGYSTVEYDLANGERGRRGQGAESMIEDLTGSEAALIVNNCAAATMLVLSVFAAGREVIVSRGEIVEIGGDFRIPDVLALSGATLREVGTTNRTKLADFERAINESTSMILRVHPSNYRVVGFTSTPNNADLVSLAHSRGLMFCEDAGSGALTDLSGHGLVDEPLIKRSIDDGVDIVTFSGDKLLGGPQAGIIVGKREYIEQMRSHSFYRALRANKLIYSSLETTLSSFLRDAQMEEVPVLRMIATGKEELMRRTESLIGRLLSNVTPDTGLELGMLDGFSAVGGGAAPGVGLETSLIAVRCSNISADELASRLRQAPKPVVARIEDDTLVLDLRTVDPSEESDLIAAIRFATQSPS
jgi:L-seryl-tRNA(Ser) seleniumtransferase